MIKLIHDDCFNIFPKIHSKSIDLILVDLPYNTLKKGERTLWDVAIDLDKMWEELKRIWKPNSVAIFFANQPFASKLLLSNLDQYKHEWIWNKKAAGNGILSKKQPLKIHENILVFMNGKTKYFPQMTKGKLRRRGGGGAFGSFGVKPTYASEKTDNYYPKSILEFSKPSQTKRFHLTEKPVTLLEYLINTYSKEGEMVLDFTAGSFSCAEACINTSRNFIGIEKDKEIFNIGEQRIMEFILSNNLPAESILNSSLLPISL